MEMRNYPEPIACAASNASKAKAKCVAEMLNVGYRSWKDVLSLIRSCRREPLLDSWAIQFSRPEIWDYDRAVESVNNVEVRS